MGVAFQTNLRRVKCKQCSRTLSETIVRGPAQLAWGFCNNTCEAEWRVTTGITPAVETRVQEVLVYGESQVVPTRADRAGDTQALPVPNDQRSIQERVIDDIQARMKVGLERYGTLLQPNNGRDALLDAYEEAMDLTMYLKQALVERDKSSGASARATSLAPDFQTP